jgi:anti-sigma B factor antagonist
MPLEIEVATKSSGVKRISLAGSLDSDTAPQLQTSIDESMDDGLKTLILDMSNLEFLSSAGLRVIFSTNKVMGKRNGKFLIAKLQPQVRKVFEIIKALGSLDVFTDDNEIDEYLAAMQQKVLDGE